MKAKPKALQFGNTIIDFSQIPNFDMVTKYNKKVGELSFCFEFCIRVFTTTSEGVMRQDTVVTSTNYFNFKREQEYDNYEDVLKILLKDNGDDFAIRYGTFLEKRKQIRKLIQETIGTKKFIFNEKDSKENILKETKLFIEECK